MNKRKMHVVNAAYQLFIDKGFQNTSIQDIIEYSGISKGTFYNYFSSKNELLIAIFKITHTELEKQQNELLIGNNPSDIEIFIKQLEIQVKTNRKRKLISIFEEVLVSNDPDLKQFLEKIRLNNILWTYNRLLDIFGETKKPVLLDCAIMFIGIMRENMKLNYMVNESNFNINHVVRYSVNRLVNLVNEAMETNEQLISPQILESWFPDCQKPHYLFKKKLRQAIVLLKERLLHTKDETKFIELLEFIEEEMLDSKNPRKFLIESALMSLKALEYPIQEEELTELEQLVEEYFKMVQAD